MALKDASGNRAAAAYLIADRVEQAVPNHA